MKSDDKNKSGKQKPTMKRRDNSKPGSTVVYRGIEIRKYVFLVSMEVFTFWGNEVYC